MDYIFFHYLMKEHEAEVARLLNEIECLKYQLSSVRTTRALMRFTREQEYES